MLFCHEVILRSRGNPQEDADNLARAHAAWYPWAMMGVKIRIKFEQPVPNTEGERG